MGGGRPELSGLLLPVIFQSRTNTSPHSNKRGCVCSDLRSMEIIFLQRKCGHKSSAPRTDWLLRKEGVGWGRNEPAGPAPAHRPTRAHTRVSGPGEWTGLGGRPWGTPHLSPAATRGRWTHAVSLCPAPPQARVSGRACGGRAWAGPAWRAQGHVVLTGSSWCKSGLTPRLRLPSPLIPPIRNLRMAGSRGRPGPCPVSLADGAAGTAG